MTDEDPFDSVDRLAGEVDADLKDATAAQSHTEEEPTTFYGSADEWLRRYWLFTYRRRVSARGSGTGRWKGDWWTVDEAVQRLEALWRSWEVARLDPGVGMSSWWLNHATPHMTALLAQDGPFAGATDENDVGAPLPYQRPPQGRFAPDLRADGDG
jgi:hypothetical protein